MDIDRDNDAASRRLRYLMRLLTNLNAGAMLALCLWLAWAALDFNARSMEAGAEITVHGCGCLLNETIRGPGNIFFLNEGIPKRASSKLNKSAGS